MNTIKKLEKMNFKYLNKEKLIEYFKAFEDKNFVNTSSAIYSENSEGGLDILRNFKDHLKYVFRNIEKVYNLYCFAVKAKNFEGETFKDNIVTNFEFEENLGFLKIKMYLKIDHTKNYRYFIKKELIINDKKIGFRKVETLHKVLSDLIRELNKVSKLIDELKN